MRGVLCPSHTQVSRCRYFETTEWEGVPPQWWYGGGTDITPAYVYEEDMKHFHGSYKAVCDAHDPEYYQKFRKWCAPCLGRVLVAAAAMPRKSRHVSRNEAVPGESMLPEAGGPLMPWMEKLGRKEVHSWHG